MKRLFFSSILFIYLFTLTAKALILYDGETPQTDLDRSNGGGYYEIWWGGQNANSLTDSTDDPYEGKKCMKWTCNVAWSGGAFMADPSWIGLNIENVTNIEFMIKGAKGGESVNLVFFDKKLGVPGEKDGHFPDIKIDNIPNKWTRYSFKISELLKNHPGKRPPNMTIFEGFMISGSPAGTVVYFDNVKMGEKPREEIVYSPIKINKLGYRPSDKKLAIINKKSSKFEIVEKDSKKVVFSGTPVLGSEFDPSSGDAVWYADFSELKKDGIYFIRLSDGTASSEFRIADDVYRNLWIDLMRVFYIQRCGIELDEKHAGVYTRPKCHTNDKRAGFALRLDGKRPKGTLDVTGGWHDAGDDNKYSQPIYNTLWYLVNAYLLNPQKFPDNLLNIPESGNGRSDLVDEILWEIKWYLKMQVKKGPEKGLVYAKVGAWDGAKHKDYLQTPRFVFQPNSADTLTFCATVAMTAYMLEKTQKDPESLKIAKECRDAAILAWKAWKKFTENGKKQYPEGGFRNPPGWGGSTAMGTDFNSEKKLILTAAVELYRLTGEKIYHDEIKARIDEYIKIFLNRDKTWGADEFLAFYNYSTLPSNMIDKDILEKMKKEVRDFKERIMEYVRKNAYRVPFGGDGHFCWGSNSHLLKNAANFFFLWKWDGKQEDWEIVQRAVDYIMGLNAVDKLMITGWGNAIMYHGIWDNPEHQPPGFVVGGVDQWDNNGWMSKYPQKCYRDSQYNWSVNEGAIYYQAAAVFMTSLFIP